MKYSTRIANPFDILQNDCKEAICVTTNAEIKKDGKAVMGAGVAKFVRDNFKGVDEKLGKLLKEYREEYGNRVFNLGTQEYKGKKFRLISFPTKNKWQDKSDIKLIEKSANELLEMANKFKLERIYLPAPGCTNGQLDWDYVSKKLNMLDERFIITSLDNRTFKKAKTNNLSY